MQFAHRRLASELAIWVKNDRLASAPCLAVLPGKSMENVGRTREAAVSRPTRRGTAPAETCRKGFNGPTPVLQHASGLPGLGPFFPSGRCRCPKPPSLLCRELSLSRYSNNVSPRGQPSNRAQRMPSVLQIDPSKGRFRVWSLFWTR